MSAHLLEADDSDPATAYVANFAGLFKTVNGGEAWQRLLTTKFPDSVAAAAARGNLIHAAAANIGAQLGLQGLGSMLVMATGATGGEVDQAAEIDGFARVRSSAICGSGAVSQSFSAVSSESFNTARRARALGLRHEPGYRTNVGIMNLGAATRNFTVVVSGERRNERFTITVPPYASAQAAVPVGDYGALTLTVISDGGAAAWVAYGSSVDNASGDAWASVARPFRGQ